MRRDGDPPRFFRVGDVLERGEDGRRGAVFAGGSVRVRVAWDDGVLEEVEHHDPAYTIVVRGYVQAIPVADPKALCAKAARLRDEAERLRSAAVALENKALHLEMWADEIEQVVRKQAGRLAFLSEIAP